MESWAGLSEIKWYAEFEKATFALGVGQTSGLVKTAYGYHIIQVEAHEQAHLQPFDDVKAQLIADYEKRQANQKMQELSDKAVAALHKDPSHPDQVGQSLGLPVIHADNVAAADTDPSNWSGRKSLATPRPPFVKVTSLPARSCWQNGKAVVVEVTDVQRLRARHRSKKRWPISRTRAGKDKARQSDRPKRPRNWPRRAQAMAAAIWRKPPSR